MSEVRKRKGSRDRVADTRRTKSEGRMQKSDVRCEMLDVRSEKEKGIAG